MKTKHTIRKPDPTELPALAQLWYDGWQVAHAAYVPASLTAIRTLESFEARLAADLNGIRVFGEIGTPLGLCMIKENEIYQPDMGPREFGLIVHDLLESLYVGYQGKKLSKTDLDNMADPRNIQQHLTEKLKERKFLRDDQLLEGRNLLNQSIIRNLVQKVVENDRRRLPFSIFAIESREFKYEITLKDHQKVKLGGTIDRIDQGEGAVGKTTIIDYKTGSVDLLPKRKSEEQNIAEYIGYYFEDGKYKSGFQGLYYALLVHHALGVEPIHVGIYELQKVNAGIRYLREEGINKAMLTEFENRLKSLITEIFNPDIPFRETEDKTKCISCPYATICSTA